jgi:competence protein ComGC
MNNKGQTLIEYLLIILTLVAVTSVVVGKLIPKLISPIQTTGYSTLFQVLEGK